MNDSESCTDPSLPRRQHLAGGDDDRPASSDRSFDLDPKLRGVGGADLEVVRAGRRRVADATTAISLSNEPFPHLAHRGELNLPSQLRVGELALPLSDNAASDLDCVGNAPAISPD